MYLPDRGRDGSGDVGLPTYTATLADGSELSADELRDKFNRPLLGGTPGGMSVEDWRALCSAPDNDPALTPETTPARDPVVLERYFNNQYTLIGIFKAPEVRAKISSAVETGFGGDPVTTFLMAFVSRRFGPVLVIRGTMPLFPDTYMGDDGQGLAVMTDWESRYWSVIMSEAPPSGMGTDALTDRQRHRGSPGLTVAPGASSPWRLPISRKLSPGSFPVRSPSTPRRSPTCRSSTSAGTASTSGRLHDRGAGSRHLDRPTFGGARSPLRADRARDTFKISFAGAARRSASSTP
ncbi:MAG: hypothetical protein ACRDOW_11165 [Nocardioidaceae bacterium]